MRVRRSHENIDILRDKRISRRGFTLVELIVVLTIVAILAAVGVVSLVGYINKSHFDENSRNAVTVYQAAQNAISAKTSNGTISDWTGDVLAYTGNSFGTSVTSSIQDVNDSYHKTISLTYNPRATRSEGSQDQILYDLLTPYFYDVSVFSGTMSIELDVSITKDTDGENIFSARVISAYYSKQNNAVSGWNDKCLGDGTNSPLPQTDYSYRQNSSYVGYFDGSEESITGPVSIPAALVDEDYIFELRNGETLDITWGFFDDPNRNATFDIRLHDEEGSASDIVLKVDEATLIYDTAHYPLTTLDPVYEYIKYENGFAAWTKLTKQQGYAKVTIGTTDYVFPLTITTVEGDLRTATPDEYTTYTISLDCLMNRAAYDITNTDQIRTKTLLGKRVFGSTPMNISAHLENGNLPGASISDSYATRAVDDPVYFTEIKLENDQIRYCYDHTAGQGREINGHCVVNTLFGDLICNNTDGSQINGSFSGSTGGTAVITAYRHLSNMRMIGNVSTSFKIARNLDWYTTYNGYYFSEVKVFAYNSSNLFEYHSPVESGSLKIVSFPAIKEFESNKTLSSLSYAPESGEGTVIYSINGVQMRNNSFVKNNDKGYGLICENKGTVYNIYTNNLNLVLYGVNDGHASDYSGGNNAGASICPNVTVTITTGGSKALASMPCGGLIGLNNGTVGNPTESVASGYNTIRMSNCIVMSSQYWKIYDGNNKNACGGIIGLNKTDKLYGLLRVDGTYAVISRDKCGGILGESEKNIGARLVISDVPFAASDFTLPVESRNNGQNMSCVVASKNIAGGAIGMLGIKENNNIRVAFTSPEVDVAQGIYTIDVTLPENSLIINAVGYPNEAAGGAIGYASAITGDKLAIRVNNYGNITVTNTNYNMYCGGVIGMERESTVTTTYIDAYNHSTSRIGYISGSSATSSSGGVYGAVHFGNNTNYVVNVINEGTIQASGTYMPANYEPFQAITDNSLRGATDPGKIGLSGCNGAGGFAGTTNRNTININLNVINRNGAAITSFNGNAGGAFGANLTGLNGTINVTTNSSYIKTTSDGSNNVGGVFGENKAVINASVTSTVELNSVLSSTDSVGGAIGYNTGNINGNITSNVAASATLTAPKWVGGAIGYNDKPIAGNIVSNMDGSINGNQYLGGALGANHNTISGSITAVVNGNITGGDESGYIGGGIGHNKGTLSGTVTITLNGNISGTAQNACLGGFIGFNEHTVSGTVNTYVNGTIIGTASDAYYISGGIGNYTPYANNSNISGTVIATIQNGAYISGNEYIGGCVGYAGGNIGGTVKAVINNDNAIRGDRDLGGCIGYVAAGTINMAAAEINTALPILQYNSVPVYDSDDDAANNEARIGGVIGYLYAGTVNNISLNGSGGQVSPAYPPKTYYNSMWITGGGRSIGGVIGQISQYAAYSNAVVKNITVENVGIVVTSSNNAVWVGGWVGACFGQMGTGSGNRANYEVNTVRAVYSYSDRIGGFCGIVDYNGTTDNGNVYGKVYANITMNLSGATISGIAETGGVFGVLNYANFNGDMVVKLMNGTRLGDYYGTVDADWGMNTASLNNCFCIEVGGAVGYATDHCTIDGGKIAVEFYDNSMLYAGGRSDADSGVQLTTAGVGGAFGTIGDGKTELSEKNAAKQSYPKIGPDQDQASRYVSVLSTSSRPCIYSAVTNTGGLIGFMYSGVVKYSFSTAVVYSATQMDGNGATGGLVGRMLQGYVNHCYVGGHTSGGQYVPGENNVTGRNYVGGLIGYMGEDTYADFCYSTASVKGNSYVGGFVGGAYTSHTGQKGEMNITYCTGRITGNDSNTTGIYAGYLDDVTSVENAGASMKNKVLRFADQYNSGLRKVGAYRQITGIFVYHNDTVHVVFADAGSPGVSNNNNINISGNRYTSHTYDNFLNNANYPLRAFVGNTHYGDWPLQPGTVQVSNSNTRASLTENMTFEYTGEPVTIPSDKLVITRSGEGQLEEGTEYYVEYLNNVDAGTATLRVFGVGRYYGMASFTFPISKADITNADKFVITVSDTVYAHGDDVEPDISVLFYNGVSEDPVILTNGTDYTVEYLDEHSQVGTANIKITGIGNFTGEVTETFEIAPFDLSDPANAVAVTADGWCDTAAQDTSNINVTVNVGTNTTLTADTDYTYTAQIVTATDDQGTEHSNLVINVTGTGNYVNGIEYSVPVYKVSFDTDGDLSTTDDRTSLALTEGQTVYEAAEPTRPQYADGFSWQVNGADYDFDTPVTGDMVILAVWTYPEYNVTIDVNGSADEDGRSTQPVRAGLTAVAPDETTLTPPVAGYVFQGWCTDLNDPDNTPFDFAAPVTADVTVYARWAAPVYHVTFVWDSNNPDSQVVVDANETNSYTVTAPATPDGMDTPVGWYEDPALGGDPYDLAIPVSGDVTLYPKFPDPNPNPNPNTDPNANQDPNANSDPNANQDPNANSDPNANQDPNANTDPNSNTDP